jgi:hypothetical protein
MPGRTISERFFPWAYASCISRWDGDAIAHFQRYLSEGGTQVPPDLRVQSERGIATLSASLVSVAISVEPVGATVIDERTPAQGAPIANRYVVTQPTLSIGIHPGRHKFAITSDDHVPRVWAFEAAPGAVLSAQFRLVRARPPRKHTDARQPLTLQKRSAPGAAHVQHRPSEVLLSPDPLSAHERETPSGVYVGIATTGALAMGATVAGILALPNHSEFDRQNSASHEDKASDLRGVGLQLNLLTDVLIGATVLAAAGTGYLYFSSASSSATPSAPTRMQARPMVGPSGGLVQVSGRF